MSKPTLLDHLLVLAFGLALPLLGVLRQHAALRSAEFDRAGRVAFVWNGALSLAVVGALTLAAWWYREGSFAGLGLGPPRTGLGPALATSAGFAAVYGLHLAWKAGTPARRAETRARWERDAGFLPRAPDELPHFAVLAVAAGVCEELVYRGLLVSYAAWYTGPELPGLALAVLLPACVFGAAHLYQGWEAALLIAAMACAFGALYLLTGSLWIPMALHAAVDLTSAWLGVRLIWRDAAPR